MEESNQILTQQQVEQIIKRIAFQIYENNFGKSIVLVGVAPGGLVIASKIKNILEEISNQKVSNFSIEVEKKNPLSEEIKLDATSSDLNGKAIILCDDVLNSGRTLAYCVRKILAFDVEKIQTAVLVLRTHSQFPIYANYKGYELSTTINEEVRVEDGNGVFLF